jgi:hypothetical protein
VRANLDQFHDDLREICGPRPRFTAQSADPAVSTAFCWFSLIHSCRPTPHAEQWSVIGASGIQMRAQAGTPNRPGVGVIKILIADDHEVVRAGLRALLSEQPDWQVVAEAADGKEAVVQALKTSTRRRHRRLFTAPPQRS